MPYETNSGRMEPSHLGHVDIVLDSRIAKEISQYHLPQAVTGPVNLSDLTIPLSQLEGKVVPSRFALAVDGSLQEVEVRSDFPSAKVGYVQVGLVCVDLAKMLARPQGGFVDPVAIANSAEKHLLSASVPSAVVRYRADLSMMDSWRERVYDLFSSTSVEDSSETLLDLVVSVLGDDQGRITLGVCPHPGCPGEKMQVPAGGSACDGGTKGAGCGAPLYPTDALRITEEVLEDGSNYTSLGRLMNVLEMFALVAQIHYLAAKCTNASQQSLDIFEAMAFIHDGPLALFGPTASLQRPLRKHLQSLFEGLREKGIEPPLLFGVEKTGVFADHAQLLSEHMDPGTVMTLSDEYIRRWIRPGTSGRAYGGGEFIGRRFFYKALDERILVITVPPSAGDAYKRDATGEDYERFPSLASVCSLLDRIGTQLYVNAVIPVALAHRYTALPLGTGSDVLRVLAQSSLGLPLQRPRPVRR